MVCALIVSPAACGCCHLPGLRAATVGLFCISFDLLELTKAKSRHSGLRMVWSQGHGSCNKARFVVFNESQRPKYDFTCSSIRTNRLIEQHWQSCSSACSIEPLFVGRRGQNWAKPTSSNWWAHGEAAETLFSHKRHATWPFILVRSLELPSASRWQAHQAAHPSGST